MRIRVAAHLPLQNRPMQLQKSARPQPAADPVKAMRVMLILHMTPPAQSCDAGCPVKATTNKDFRIVCSQSDAPFFEQSASIQLRFQAGDLQTPAPEGSLLRDLACAILLRSQKS